jgi:hypothetical protein
VPLTWSLADGEVPMRDEHGVQRLATDRRTLRTRVSRVRCRVSGGPFDVGCVLHR